MGYSVNTKYRVIERETVSGKSKFFPQVSYKETLLFRRVWNYYKGGVLGDENLSFDTMELAENCIKEIKGHRVLKTKIHYL